MKTHHFANIWKVTLTPPRLCVHAIKCISNSHIGELELTNNNEVYVARWNKRTKWIRIRIKLKFSNIV